MLELVEVIENGSFISDKRQALIDEANIGPYLTRDVIFAPPKKKQKSELASSDDGEESGKPKNDGD